MDDYKYVYSITIETTAEKLWEALTQDEFWHQYWDGEWRVESKWQKGAAVTFYTQDGNFYSEGEVLESEHPKKLVYTWPNLPEEQGSLPPEVLAWSIESLGPRSVRLTLTHTNLTKKYYEGVSEGWPVILSNLQSLLEKGAVSSRARKHSEVGGPAAD